MSQEIDSGGEMLEDRGIPPISQSRPSQFLAAAAITVVICVMVYLSYTSISRSTNEEPQELQAQVETPYDRERSYPAPEMALEEPTPVAVLPLPKPVMPAAVEQTSVSLSDEDLYKRRRSPLVIYDKIITNSREVTATLERDDIALVDKIIDANAEANNAKDGDSLNSRLKATTPLTVKANVIQDPDFLIAQGKTIGAVMETAVSSDLPGMVRAVVNEVIYSENGKTAIIPKGSRVIGEYRGGIVRGQGRLFVIWNRVITPEGIDIQIQSPGADQLGRSGHSGWLDTHFKERFGASFLLSMVGAATAQSGDSEVEEQFGDNLNASAEIALQESIGIRPTLHKNQGEAIQIFVARDLNFRQALMLVNR